MPLLVDVDILAKAAVGVTAQKPNLRAEMGQPPSTVGARPTAQQRVGADPIANHKARNVRANSYDSSGNLVTRGERGESPAEGVGRVHSREDRASRILMQVGAADAAPVYLHLYLSGAWG